MNWGEEDRMMTFEQDASERRLSEAGVERAVLIDSFHTRVTLC
jgi:hypothetical protein